MDWRWRNSIKIAINQYFQEKIWLIVFEGPRRWLQVKVAFFLDLYPFERSRLEMMRNVSVCNSEMRSCSFWEPQNRRLDKNSCRPDVFSFWVGKSSRMVIVLTEQLVAVQSKRLIVVFGWVQSFGISFEIRMSAAEIKLDLKLSSRIEATDLCRSWSVI